MRLVSLNTWKNEGHYARRLEATCSGLMALSPDVVALQEDFRTDDGQHHTAQVIAQALNLHLTWVPARAKLRQVMLRSVASTSGLAILSRYPVVEQRVLNLPDDPSDGQRLAQCVRLPDALGGGWLVNLHLTHLDERPGLRQAQLSRVVRELGQWATTERWLLCGDFNAGTADHAIGSSLWPRGPLHDAFAGRRKGTHVDEGGQIRDLDHILWRAPLGRAVDVRRAWVALDQAEKHGLLASDHFAVCADIL